MADKHATPSTAGCENEGYEGISKLSAGTDRPMEQDTPSTEGFENKQQ